MRLKIGGWSELRTQLFVAGSALIGLVFLGTVVYRYLEGWTWTTSFYFSVCTISTVGYGDFYPTTDLSRLFTAVYILVGVGIALASLGIIGANYLKRSQAILKNIRDGA